MRHWKQGVAVLLAGCPDPQEAARLEAAVFVRDQAGEVLCVAAADSLDSDDFRCPVVAADFGLVAADGEAPAIVAGSSELIFGARLHVPNVSDPVTLTAPALQLAVDGLVVASPSASGWTRAIVADEAVFQQSWTVVASARSTLQLRVDGGPNLQAELPPIDVSPAGLSVDVPACQGLPSPCAIVRGTTGLAVTVDTPPSLAGDVTLTQLVDGATVSTAIVPATGTLVDGVLRRQVTIAAPTTAHARAWDLLVTHADLGDASSSLILADPPELEVAITAPGTPYDDSLFAPGMAAHRGVLGDADGCREATVWFRAQSPEGARLPASLQVVVASSSEVDAQLDEVDIALDDMGHGQTTLSWSPGPSTDPAVLITATGGPSSVTTEWTLEDTPAGSAAIAPPVATLLVGGSGSPPQHLNGLLVSPGSTWTLGASYPLAIAVTAVADPTVGLSCGSPIPPSLIACDRSGILGAGPAIACVMTPTLPTSTMADGSFAIDLASACFAGTVTVQVFAPIRDSTSLPPACLWQEPPPETLGLASFATLTYQAE